MDSSFPCFILLYFQATLEKKIVRKWPLERWLLPDAGMALWWVLKTLLQKLFSLFSVSLLFFLLLIKIPITLIFYHSRQLQYLLPLLLTLILLRRNKMNVATHTPIRAYILHVLLGSQVAWKPENPENKIHSSYQEMNQEKF